MQSKIGKDVELELLEEQLYIYQQNLDYLLSQPSYSSSTILQTQGEEAKKNIIKISKLIEAHKNMLMKNNDEQ